MTSPTTGPGWNIFDAVRPQVPQVYRSQEGTGFPSASRALARLPRNTNDANGYYQLLGVDPWATDEEVKKAFRRKMAEAHPDHPRNRDADEVTKSRMLKFFMRLQEIGEVMLNPILRRNYNLLPPGRKLVDSEVKQDLAAQGIVDDPTLQHFADPDEVRIKNRADPKPDEPAPVRRERMFDYMATGSHAEIDLLTANAWYQCLIDVAPMFHFTATVKVLLHDGKHSAVKKIGNIIMIPRQWEPSTALAFSIFERHFGWPKFREPVVEVDPEWTPRQGAPATFNGTGINGGGGHLANTRSFLGNVHHLSVRPVSVDPGSS